MLAIMIFLLVPRYLSLDAEQKRSRRSADLDAVLGARGFGPEHITMIPKAFIVVLTIASLHQAAAKPVRRTLNFNMFVLKPHDESPERFVMSTNGVSRFGPILEYLVQRVQGLMSVRRPPEQSVLYDQNHANDHLANNLKREDTENAHDAQVPMADAAENEVDSVPESRMPGVVVRPSRTKPGTYEVEIDVVVDDGDTDDKKASMHH